MALRYSPVFKVYLGEYSGGCRQFGLLGSQFMSTNLPDLPPESFTGVIVVLMFSPYPLKILSGL